MKIFDVCFNFSNENDLKFGRKSCFFSLILLIFRSFDTRMNNQRVYITFSKSVDDLRHKILKIGQKMTNLQSFEVANGVKYFIY